MASRESWLVLSAVLAAVAPGVGAGADWPQFGGPRRDLTVVGSGLLDGRAIELRILWKRPLGSGYSGFAVAGDRAVTLFSDGTSDLIVALDAATGKEIWRRVIAPTYRGHSGSDDGPLGTPTIHGDRVFAVGRGGELLALRLEDGREVWSRSLVRDFGAEPPRFGFSTSPFIAEGVLVIQAGGTDGRSIVGLDPVNGESIWSQGEDPVDHQSPLPAVLAGERHVLAVGRREMVGLRPGTGEVVWRHRHRSEPDVWAQPVVVSDQGVFLSYYDSDGVFFRVSKTDNAVEVKEVWRSELLKRSHVVPIFHDGLLYGFRGNLLFGVDPANGKEVWASGEPGNGGAILVDGHLVSLAPRGQLVIGQVSERGYDEKARLDVLSRGSLTPPSLAGRRIFVRNLRQAACVVVGDGPL